MDTVYRLSRREAKPLMGRPNVLSYSKPRTLTFGINLGIHPPRPERKNLPRGGKKINGVPVITPSPKVKKTTTQKRDAFPRQRQLFEMYSSNKKQKARMNNSYLQPFKSLYRKRRLF